MKKTIGISSVIILSLFIGCNSIKQPDSVFQYPDYTQDDVRKEEIKRINEMLDENNVQALFRASILNDESTKQKCAENIKAELKKSMDDKDYFNALRLYKSMDACGVDVSDVLDIKAFDLDMLSKADIALQTPSKQNVKVSTLINGTVTVLVDKGIKFENGLGFADRVIGSGFFISKNGYIVTNNHVIADCVDPKNREYSKLYIKLAEDSDTKIPAVVVGWDPLVDLALLKTEIDAPYVFPLGSSHDLEIGDKIFCIGSPIGLERTLTSGIVSADNRNLSTIAPVLQIDAAVNSGNSGGPCVDVYGNVQAVVFAGMLQYEGLNFAIPVEYLKAELAALYHGGKLVHPWFGIYGNTKKDLGKECGVELKYVLPGSGASRIGMQAQDVIVEVDGQKVTNLEEIKNVLLRNCSKSIIKISYLRGEELKKSFVYLAKRPENPGYAVYNNDLVTGSFLPIFGMDLASVSASNNKKYMIKTILKGSIADETGFSENEPLDIINVDFNSEKSVITAQVYTKIRKKGYLDVNMMIAAPLDSPFYF